MACFKEYIKPTISFCKCNIYHRKSKGKTPNVVFCFSSGIESVLKLMKRSDIKLEDLDSPLKRSPVVLHSNEI